MINLKSFEFFATMGYIFTWRFKILHHLPKYVMYLLSYDVFKNDLYLSTIDTFIEYLNLICSNEISKVGNCLFE